MKKSIQNPRKSLRRKLLTLAVASCFAAELAYGNPIGPTVVNGQVTFNNSGNLYQITNTPGAIINWQAFSISSGEITRFIQQSASSAVLNRVTGGNPSLILGALQSNGRVFLINSSGIAFGAGAQVDTAGLVTSTLAMSNADFQAGRYRFTEVPGAGNITNQGRLTASGGGSIYIVASNVENSGVIRSDNGQILLAAGKSVELVNPNSPDVRVQITAPDNQVVNLGQLIAQGGSIGIYGGLIRQGGVVNANSAVMGPNGKIVFKATKDVKLEAGSVTTASGPQGGSITIQADTGKATVAGTVEANGTQGKGGTITVVGQQGVAVEATAHISANGNEGGSVALTSPAGSVTVAAPVTANATVGRAGEIAVTAATTAALASSARLSASGGQGSGVVAVKGSGGVTLDVGSVVAASGATGGSVTVQADQGAVVAQGTIDATATDGAGGSVQISALSDITLDDSSQILVGGRSGGVVKVQSGEGTLLASGLFSGQGNDGPGGEVWLLAPRVGLIREAIVNVSGLTGGGTVLVGGDYHGGNPDIPNALQSYVGANVSINADAIQIGNGGNVVVWADNTTQFYGTISARGGANSGNGGFVETSGGWLDATGTVNTYAPYGFLGTWLLDPTNIYIAASLGNANTAGMVGNDVTAGSTAPNFVASGAVVDSLLLTGTLVTALGSNNVTVTTANAAGGGVGNITVVDPITYAGATNRTLQMTAANNIAVNANISGTAAQLGVTLTATAGTVTTVGAIASRGGDVSISAGSTASLASIDTTGGAGTGNFSVTSTGTTLNSNITTLGSQTFNGPVTLASAVILASTGSGAINLTGTVNGAQTLAVNTAGTTTFGGVVGGATPLTSITTNAAGTTAINTTAVSTSGVQTYNDPVTLGANTTLTSSGAGAAGNITFAGTVNGAQTLAVNTAGTTTFGGMVGGATPLTSITTDAAGSVAVNGGGATTSGGQTYNDALSLGANAVFTGTTGSFNGAITGGGFDLTLNFSGLTTVNGSTFTGVNNFATGNGGTTDLSGTITTTGTQTYNDVVTLSGATTLTSSGAGAAGNITLASTVNGAQTLAVNTAGTTTFGGVVGGATPLTSITTDAAGTTAINTTAVSTSGAQTYNDPVTLGANTTLTGAGVSFVNTLNGAQTLLVNDSGTTTFGGVVGGATPLTSITTDAAGTTAINTTAVSTSGVQTYNDPVTLGANTTLTGAGVSFVNTLNGAQTLLVNDSGTTTFGGVVGGATPLTSITTNAAGTTAINTTAVSTSGVQTYNDPVTLGANTTLTSSGAGAAGNITFAGTVNGAQTLAVNTAGTTTFGGMVGGATPLTSITTDAAGSVAVNGGGATTSGGQTYNDALSLGANAVFTGTTGSFNGAITGGGFDLTLNFSGLTTVNGSTFTGVNNFATGNGGTTDLSGTITTTGTQTYNDVVTLSGATTLTSSGAGAAGNITLASTVNGAQTLAVNTAGTTTFGGVVGGATPLTSITTNAAGTTAINTTAVSTSGVQTYNDPVTLGANTTLTSSGAGAAGNITFAGTVNGAQTLAVNTAGTTTFGGMVGGATPLTSITTDAAGSVAVNGGGATTSGGQTYNDALSLGANAVFTGTTGSFNGAITGGGFDLTLNFSGLTTVNGSTFTGVNNFATGNGGTTDLSGTITTTGTQTYNDVVTLSGATTLTSSGAGAAGNITLASTVNGAQTLAVNTAGTTTFGGMVGGATPLTSITTDAAGSVAVNGGGATTSGGQTYNDALSLGANAVFTGTTGSFNGAITGGGFDLTLNFSGLTTVNGSTFTGVNNFATGNGGTTDLSGTITTTGTQTYNDVVTLSGATTLTSSGAGAAGNITLASTVNGAQTLAVNTAGTTTFGGVVGGATPLTSITTNAAGTTAINTTAVSTSGVQTYNDPVTLGANTTLTSSGAGAAGNITFAGTVNGAQTLAVNTAGTTTFGGMVGGATPLTSITTDAAGSVAVNGGGATTSGGQTYNDALSLGANAVFTGTTGSFNGAITGGGFDLTLNFSGLTTVNGSTFTGVNNFATGNGGTTDLSGTITTTGTQTYNDVVTLSGATTLTSSGAGAAGNITLASTVNGAQTLAVNTAGTTTFGGVVGGATPLTSITTNAAGTTAINTTAVSTSGVQTYNDPVTLGANTTLTSSGAGAAGNITFAGTVNGAQTLAVNTAGTTTFGGMVGGATPLTSITTDAAGSVAVNGGGATTSGGQTYNDALSLGANAVFTGTTGSFNGAITGGGFDLTLNFSGLTTVNGSTFTGVNNFATGNGGTTDLSGTITTTGTQTYNDVVTLSGATTLTSSGAGAAGNITLASTVNGAQTLAVNTAGTTTFGGVVGGATPLTSITTDAAGTTAINTTAVSTSGAQTYNDPVTLGANTTLTGAGVSFVNTLNGAQTLLVNDSGTTTFGGVVGGATPLTSITTDAAGTTAINTTAVSTSGVQTYNDPVTLGANTTLTGAGVSFVNTLNGAQTLLVNDSGTTTFGGVVGGATPLTSITTNAAGTTAINTTAVSTSGVQTYNDPVTLGANTTLTSSGAGAAGNITFAGTVNGAQTLAVNTAGTTTFGGMVGGATPLTSITTDAAGSVAVNGGGATTSGGQTYNDALSLGANAVFTGTTGSFNGAITGGGFDLTLNFSGLTTVNGSTFTGVNNFATGNGGTTDLSGTITTTGTQTYNDVVTLSGATTLTSSGAGAAGNITLASTVNGAQTLAVNTAGTTTFGGVVGGATPLTSITTNAAGTTAINTTAVSTSGVQTYNDPVTLGANTTLTSSGAGAAGNITFAGTVNGAQTLAVNTAGTTTFGGMVGGATPLTSITTDAAGSVAVNGGGATTSGGQTYNDALSLGANAVFTGTTGSFNGAITGGGFDLTLNFSGLTTVNGSTFTGVNNFATGNGGTTDLSGTITTTGTQTYNDVVTLSGATTLTSSGAGAAGNITLASTVNGAQTLAVNTAGTTTFGGVVGGATPLTSITTDAAGTTAINTTAVSTSGAQTYNDPVTLGANTTLTGAGVSFVNTLNGAQTLLVNDSGTTTFGGVVGGATPLTSITTDAAGTTAINTTAVSTSGVQTYNDPVTLGANTTLTGAGVSFVNTLNGAQTLLVNDSGTTTFGGVVGGATPLTSITTNAAGTTAINTTAVSTSGVQTYNDPVTLGANTTLTGAGVSFVNTLNGAQTLLVNDSGTTTFGGVVGGATPLTSITTDAAGTTAINTTAVSTSGVQTYNDPVTLGANTTLTGAGVSFVNTLNGAQTLLVNDSGTTTFGGVVGGATPLTSITTDAAGTTAINTTAVSTSGVQTYNDPVTLGANTTLTGAGVSFVNTLNGAQTLLVNDSGTTTFGGVVGGATPLTSITTNAAGTTAINTTAVSTSGVQTYNDPVTLGANTTLTGAGVSFVNTLNGAQTLLVNDSGTTTFGGVVGGATPLTSITTNAAGTTAINTTAVSTSGVQTYNDPVTLGANTTLTGAGVSFVNTLNGAQTLLVNDSGTTTFGGVVGGATPLTSITTNAAGTTAINTTAVSTSGVQTYNDPVTLGANTTLTGAGVSFVNTLNGAQTLLVNDSGTTTFGGVVGGATPLTSITTNAAGTTAINTTAVSTSGVQTYNDPVTLGANTTLTGAGVSFVNTLNGAQTLLVNDSGTTTFGGVVGGATPLTSITTDAAGTTAINTTAVSTSGVQTYNDPVTLGANTTLTGAGVSFVNTLNGAQTLLVNDSGTTTFGGVVGGATPLTSITTNAAGTTAINTTAVSTSGVQTYNDPVTLGANTTLTGAGVSFVNTLNGAQTLLVNDSGTTTFGGVVGGATPLTSITTNAAGTTAINTTAVSTSGVQTYNDPVTLGANTTLTGAGVSFVNTLNGAQTLLVNDSGTTTFGGVVGGATPLTSITTDAAGTTAINTTAVSTSGVQTYNDPVTLGANTTLTGAGVSFVNTLNGAQTLLVNDSGTTTFGGVVGGATPLTSITTNAAGTTAINTTAVSTSGVQTYNDPVTLGANTTLTSSGAGAAGNITFAGTVNGAQTLAVNTAGTTTFGGMVGGATPLTSITTDAAGSVAVNGGGATTSGGQTYNDAVTLGAAASLTSTSSGTINFVSTLDGTTPGAQNLTLNAGASGNIIFTGVVGTTRLGAISITNANNVTESAGITAASLTQVAGTAGGLTLLTGAVDTNTATGVSLTTAGAITVNNTITTTTGASGGGVALANGQLLTLNGNIVSDGTVQQTGAGLVSVTGTRTITTTGDAVSFATGVTLANPSSLSIDTTAGPTLTGNNITFSSTLDGTTAGAQPLTLNAGTNGNITFVGNVGGASAASATRLGAVQITNANDVNIDNWLVAASLVQSAGQGSTTISNPVNTNSATGVQLTSGGFSIDGTITTTGNGVVTFTNNLGTLALGSDIIADGAVTQNGTGPVSIAGTRTITTTGDAVSFATGVTLANPSSLSIDTTVGPTLTGNNITFSGTLNGTTAGAQNLTLNAGTNGNVLFTGAVGGAGAAARLGDISITNANNVTESAGITAKSLTQVAGNAAGTTLLTGAVNTNGVNAAGEGVSLTTSGTITNNNGISNNGGSTITSLTANRMLLGGGTIANGSGAVNLTSTTPGAGNTYTINLGSATDGAASTLELSNAELNTITTTGTLTIGSTPSILNHTGQMTISAPLTFTNPSGPVVLQTSGGNINVNSTVNVSASNLTLSTTGAGAATGAIVDTGAGLLNLSGVHNLNLVSGAGIGSVASTQPLHINLNNTATLQASNSSTGDINITNPGSVTLANNFSNSGAGELRVAAVNGNIDTSTVNVSASGGRIAFIANDAGAGGNITVGSGGITNTNGAVLLYAADTITVNGAVSTGGVVPLAGVRMIAGSGAGINLALDPLSLPTDPPLATEVADDIGTILLNARIDPGAAGNIILITSANGAGGGILGGISQTKLGVVGSAAGTSAGTLTAVTLRGASSAVGAPIALGANAPADPQQNAMATVNLFSCMTSGCPGPRTVAPFLTAAMVTDIAPAPVGLYANGPLAYTSNSLNVVGVGGSVIAGVGTSNNITFFNTGNFTLTGTVLTATNLTFETTGTTTVNLSSGPITNANILPGGTLTIVSGINTVYSSAGPSNTIGSAAVPFDRNLVFTAGGDITINSPIFIGSGGSLAVNAYQSGTMNNGLVAFAPNGTGTVTFQGNNEISVNGPLTINAQNLSVLGGQIAPVSPNQQQIGERLNVTGAFTFNVVNPSVAGSGNVIVQAGTATAGSDGAAIIMAPTINFGTAGNRVNSLALTGGTSNVTGATSQYSDAQICAGSVSATGVCSGTGVLNAYIGTGGLTLTGNSATIGSLAAANVQATARANLQGGTVTLDVLGPVALTGGTSNAASGLSTLVTDIGADASATIIAKGEFKPIFAQTLALTGGSATASTNNSHAIANALLQSGTGLDLTVKNTLLASDAILLQGGTAIANAGGSGDCQNGGGVCAAAVALITNVDQPFQKITIQNEHLTIKGGTATASGPSSVASAVAGIDPVYPIVGVKTLSITTPGGIDLTSGASNISGGGKASSSAFILSPGTIELSAGQGITVTGGPGSGLIWNVAQSTTMVSWDSKAPPIAVIGFLDPNNQNNPTAAPQGLFKSLGWWFFPGTSDAAFIMTGAPSVDFGCEVCRDPRWNYGRKSDDEKAAQESASKNSCK